MQWVNDMMGRTLEIPDHPCRIISLVPSQTELLADLGLDQEVVGITKFCVHPETWFRNKTRVGGTKTVHLDRIRALKPDLILANKEENVEEQILQMEQFAPVWVSDIRSLDDALKMIRGIGAICQKQEAAEGIHQQIVDGFRRLQSRRAAVEKPNKRVAYAIWRDPWMWAGGDTFISDLLGQCNLVNVFQDIHRYPSEELPKMSELMPDIVMLSSEPYPFKENHQAEVQQMLPDTKVILVDGAFFSWYGSRLLKAPEYLASIL